MDRELLAGINARISQLADSVERCIERIDELDAILNEETLPDGSHEMKADAALGALVQKMPRNCALRRLTHIWDFGIPTGPGGDTVWSSLDYGTSEEAMKALIECQQ